MPGTAPGTARACHPEESKIARHLDRIKKLGVVPRQGNADQVAQPSWRSESLRVVLRSEVKAGCLDQTRGAMGATFVYLRQRSHRQGQGRLHSLH